MEIEFLVRKIRKFLWNGHCRERVIKYCPNVDLPTIFYKLVILWLGKNNVNVKSPIHLSLITNIFPLQNCCLLLAIRKTNQCSNSIITAGSSSFRMEITQRIIRVYLFKVSTSNVFSSTFSSSVPPRSLIFMYVINWKLVESIWNRIPFIFSKCLLCASTRLRLLYTLDTKCRSRIMTVFSLWGNYENGSMTTHQDFEPPAAIILCTPSNL
jgi:hypothetical protein